MKDFVSFEQKSNIIIISKLAQAFNIFDIKQFTFNARIHVYADTSDYFGIYNASRDH